MTAILHWVRDILAAACLTLFTNYATATDYQDYLRVYTFDPPLIVDHNGVQSALIVTPWGYDGRERIRYISETAGVEFTLAGGGFTGIFSEAGSFCYQPALAFPPPPYINLAATTVTEDGCVFTIRLPGTPTYKFRVEVKPVIQIQTAIGQSLEALPLVLLRDDKPWQTYYFGYKMGLVAKTSDYLFDGTERSRSLYESLKKSDFKLAQLPRSQVEGEVVEYVNTEDFPLAPGGHFFYSADPFERVVVDGGGAGKFKRTGRSFKAGGYAKACRFYGSQQPGPNSHFFTVDSSECAYLKSLQKNPIPTTEQQWNYEGQGFAANTPIPGSVAGGASSCPANSVPVYRAYNNAFGINGKNPWDSNHRFSTDLNDIQEVVTKYGWRNEGVAMCVP